MKSLICFILLPIAIAFLLMFWPSRNSFSDIKDRVRIDRDENGAPHIYASSEEDAMFAYGYVCAEDRLWQMDISRRFALGRLSEFFGYRSVEVDVFMRNTKLFHYAKTSYEALEPRTKVLVESYVSGINSYLESHYLPLEYWYIWSSTQKWEPFHVQAQMYMVGLGLASSWGHELLNYKLQSLFGPKGEELISLDSQLIREVVSMIPDEEIKTQTLQEPLEVSEYQEMMHMDVPEIGENGGSNVLVISGKHTQSGKPIIAADPHLAHTMPSFFYFIGIHINDDIHIEGFVNPGGLLLVFGRNQDVALGATSTKTDGVDIFLEKVNGTMAYYEEKWHKMETFKETFIVKGQDPLEVEFYETRHGPIIDERFLKGGYAISKFFAQGSVTQKFSMKTYFSEFHDKSLNYFTKIFSMKSVNDLNTSLERSDYVYLSLASIDSQGNIRIGNSGRIPNRKTIGDFPVPGWLSKYEWEGVLGYEHNHFIQNPQQGFIVNANNYPTSLKHHNFKLGNLYAEGRAERITEMIEEGIKAGKKFSEKDMREIQMDTLDVLAQDSLPAMLKLIPSNYMKEKVDLIRNWDFRASADSYEAALYYSWIRHTSKLLLEQHLQDAKLIKDIMSSYTHNYFIYRMFNDTRYEWWCDDPQTEIVENCEVLLMKSLDIAAKETEKKKWGDIHLVHPRHAVSLSPLGFWFDREMGTGGTQTTPYAVSHQWGNGYIAYEGPTIHMIIDLGGDSSFMIDAGQSGNSFSRHYSDMFEDFHRGKYKKWTFGSYTTVTSYSLERESPN